MAGLTRCVRRGAAQRLVSGPYWGKMSEGRTFHVDRVVGRLDGCSGRCRNSLPARLARVGCPLRLALLLSLALRKRIPARLRRGEVQEGRRRDATREANKDDEEEKADELRHRQALLEADLRGDRRVRRC